MAAGGGRRLNYEKGRVELTELQEEFLKWLMGERTEGDTQTAWAQRHGVSPQTVTAWKKDRSFVAEWEERLRATHAHPDVISTHLAALNKKGAQGDVQAIKLYHEIVSKMWPDQRDPEDELMELSDEELADLAESIFFLRSDAS